MTQPPYVPPRDDDSTNTPVWPSPQEPTYAEPTYTESTYSEASYVEPVSSVAVGGTYTQDQGPSSTKDVAKDQAANVKDTAVGQGQQVAGVAKEQAGAVKDTAVQQGQHVAGVAKEQAGAVKDTAVQQGQHVAEVAKAQVSQVASEASFHVKDLLSEGVSELRGQAGSQQKRLATGIHSLAGELGSMAAKSDKSGPLTDYAQQLSRKGGEIAHYIENAEPSELLDVLRNFARRRPGVFLASSALAGAVVGRLTRGLASNAKDEKQAAVGSSYSSSPQGQYGSDQYATGQYTTSEYSSSPQYSVESGVDTPYSQDVTTSGSGYGYNTAPGADYGVSEPTTPYGTTGNSGVTR